MSHAILKVTYRRPTGIMSAGVMLPVESDEEIEDRVSEILSMDQALSVEVYTLQRTLTRQTKWCET